MKLQTRLAIVGGAGALALIAAVAPASQAAPAPRVPHHSPGVAAAKAAVVPTLASPASAFRSTQPGALRVAVAAKPMVMSTPVVAPSPIATVTRFTTVFTMQENGPDHIVTMCGGITGV